MKNHPFRFAFILTLAALISPGCGLSSKNDASPVLARFDGAVITQKQFEKKVAALPKELQSVVTRRKKDLLSDMANEHYLLKEAKRRGIEKLPDVRELMTAAHQKISIAKLLEIEIDSKISLQADEAAKFYEEHKEQFMTPLLLRASHILVSSEEDANTLKAKLDAGGDFEEIARTKSLDQTAARGGDIGFFQKGQLIPEFEEKAYSMKKGQVSDAFKSQFGYHIIKLTDRAEPTLRDFKMVKPLIERQMAHDRKAKKFEEYIEKLKGNSKINIDEKALESALVPAAKANENIQ